MFESLSELNETVDTLNCKPQSFPKDTEESLNCMAGIFAFFVSDWIFSEMFCRTDFEITTNFEFFSEVKTCFEPRVHLFPLIASFSAFSSNLIIIHRIVVRNWGPY